MLCLMSISIILSMPYIPTIDEIMFMCYLYQALIPPGFTVSGETGNHKLHRYKEAAGQHQRVSCALVWVQVCTLE